MKLTEYIYYIYSYLNIYRNKKIINISDQYGENWDFFFNKIICIFPKFPVKSKKNIIQILSYTKIYNSNYNYRYNTNKNF